MDSLQASEKCFYAIDIKNLTELECSNKSSVLSLKILHCNNLTSTRGISRFTNLAELDISSNQIDDLTELETLESLVSMNLSCNQIYEVPLAAFS
jgi:Leucine-rich repeat (LRR) protein